jgi:hypothetical protein
LRVQPIFVPKKRKLLIVAPSNAKIIERAQIAAGREGAFAIRCDNDAADCRIGCPFAELLRETADHGRAYRIERLRPIEGDQPGCTAAVEEQIGLGAHSRAFWPAQLASRSLLMIKRMPLPAPPKMKNGYILVTINQRKARRGLLQCQ